MHKNHHTHGRIGGIVYSPKDAKDAFEEAITLFPLCKYKKAGRYGKKAIHSFWLLQAL